jgi:hypothetical protein
MYEGHLGEGRRSETLILQAIGRNLRNIRVREKVAAGRERTTAKETLGQLGASASTVPNSRERPLQPSMKSGEDSEKLGGTARTRSLFPSLKLSTARALDVATRFGKSREQLRFGRFG